MHLTVGQDTTKPIKIELTKFIFSQNLTPPKPQEILFPIFVTVKYSCFKDSHAPSTREKLVNISSNALTIIFYRTVHSK